MKSLVVVAAIGVVALVTSFQFAPAEMGEFDQAQIEAQVLAVMQEFLDGMNELDMAKVEETTHPGHMALSLQGRILNRSEYREAMDQWATDKKSWHGTWHDTSVRILSPEAAVFTGLYSIDLIEYEDQPARHYPQNAWSILVERTPDGWKWSMGGHSSSGYEVVE
jgi:hypothetical protein